MEHETVRHGSRGGTQRLTAEAVEGAALALEGVHDIEGSDGLTASVLGVGDGITDDVLEEDLEDTAGLLVDEAGDALHTATTSQTADGGLLQESRGREVGGGCEARARVHGGMKAQSPSPPAPPSSALLTVMPWMLSRNTLR